jgi:hypothetical protein
MHSIEAFTTLLEFGADIQKGNEASHTPLHFAAESGQMEIVRLIMERWPEGLRAINSWIHHWIWRLSSRGLRWWSF